MRGLKGVRMVAATMAVLLMAGCAEGAPDLIMPEGYGTAQPGQLGQPDQPQQPQQGCAGSKSQAEAVAAVPAGCEVH
jgi:hypothetical protein